jgi:glycosyltransferase involved in cell wall biosynthesis
MAAPHAFAIPFHAGLEYLREAVSSVRAQEDPSWTLTIVDDSGAPGAVRALVTELGDARVRCLENARNLGMVATWNRCLDEVEPAAELLTLLHADDRLLPGYVGAFGALAARQPEAAALFCAARTIGADGRARLSLQDDVKRFFVPRGAGDVRLAGEHGLAALMRGNFVVCPTLAFRRARLAQARFDPRWRQVQDLALLARLLFLGEPLAGLRAPLYEYRRHAANATARQTADFSRFEEEFALFDEVARDARERGWRSVERSARRKTIVRLHLGVRACAAGLALRFGEAATSARFALRR